MSENENRTGVWMRAGSLVYRLMETGESRRDPETKVYGPILQNEFSIRVDSHPGAPPKSDEILAEALVAMLNKVDAADA
jgi:hypothetical protein